MRIAIVGGGTGGHIYPGLAIARYWEEKGEVVFLGQKDKLEGKIIPREGYSFFPISAAPLERKISPKVLGTAFKLILGLGQAYRFLAKFRPDVVVGTGGYVAAPAVLAAILRKIPVVIHEQNAFPSLTNRLLSSYAQVVCLSIDDARNFFPRAKKIVLTGNPVRKEIISYSREKARKELKLEEKDLLVMVMGGSQGAQSLNLSMVKWLEKRGVPSDWKIIHATGENNFEQVVSFYNQGGIDPNKIGNIKVTPYIKDVASIYAAADLFIGRSGATTVAELMARKLPAILIPYPYATDDHQKANALYLEKIGAAKILPDEELEEGKLGILVEDLLNNREKLKNMRNAENFLKPEEVIEKIAEVMQKVAKKQR